MSFWGKFGKVLQRRQDECGPSTGRPDQEKAVEDVTTQTRLGEFTESPAEALELEISAQTDPGVIRTNNEDRGFYTRPTDPLVAAAKGTLIIVADGMGGAMAGEVASDMAIRLIPEFYFSSPKEPAVALKEALESTSKKIHQRAQAEPEKRGMGTTCVALAILQPQAFMAYVGDSRLYLLRDGYFYQLTEDHSVVFEMVRSGIITRDQALNHEERNVLTLSMGGRPEITASYWEKPMMVRKGDRFLVCTDGLHDLVSDSEIQTIISDGIPDVAVHNLIDAAKRHGGHDNITAALVHVHNARVKLDIMSRPTREMSIQSE